MLTHYSQSLILRPQQHQPNAQGSKEVIMSSSRVIDRNNCEGIVQDGTCCICREGFANSSVPFAVCGHNGHVFHVHCFHTWTVRSGHENCPMCRGVFQLVQENNSGVAGMAATSTVDAIEARGLGRIQNALAHFIQTGESESLSRTERAPRFVYNPSSQRLIQQAEAARRQRRQEIANEALVASLMFSEVASGDALRTDLLDRLSRSAEERAGVQARPGCIIDDLAGVVIFRLHDAFDLVQFRRSGSSIRQYCEEQAVPRIMRMYNFSEVEASIAIKYLYERSLRLRSSFARQLDEAAASEGGSEEPLAGGQAPSFAERFINYEDIPSEMASILNRNRVLAEEDEESELQSSIERYRQFEHNQQRIAEQNTALLDRLYRSVEEHAGGQAPSEPLEEDGSN